MTKKIFILSNTKVEILCQNTILFQYRNSFPKSSNSDLDPINLKPKLVQDIVTPYACVKLYQNRLTNDGARAMTKFF